MKNLILIHLTAAATGLWWKSGVKEQNTKDVACLGSDCPRMNWDMGVWQKYATLIAYICTHAYLCLFDTLSLTSPIIRNRSQNGVQTESEPFEIPPMSGLLSVPVIRLGTSLLGSGQLVPTNTLCSPIHFHTSLHLVNEQFLIQSG